MICQIGTADSGRTSRRHSDQGDGRLRGKHWDAAEAVERFGAPKQAEDATADKL